MAKPVGAVCNLRCSYCYYLEKAGINGAHSKMMSDETLELFIKEYIESQTSNTVMFTSDNGPHAEGGADPDFFGYNTTLRGIKRHTHEGKVRVPFIA